jgi:hypothetical protein
MKCLCPTPDYINVPGILGNTTYLLKGFGTVLHYKKADRKCYRCDTPICGDCAVEVGRFQSSGNAMTSWVDELCHVCEEYTS